MNWIPVEKDIPNLDFEVLVNDQYGCVASGWLLLRDGCKVFVDSEGEEYRNITHWQPLPLGIVSENL